MRLQRSEQNGRQRLVGLYSVLRAQAGQSTSSLRDGPATTGCRSEIAERQLEFDIAFEGARSLIARL